MGQHVLIVEGHPNRFAHHLCGALAGVYARGAAGTSREVHRIDVSQPEVPLLRSREEFDCGLPAGDRADAVASMAWAEYIVFVFPLWLGTMPAILKAFLDREP